MTTKPLMGPSDPYVKSVRLYPKLYWYLCVGTIAAYVIFILAALLLWSVQPVAGLGVGFPLLLFVAIHISKSWGMVETNEWAAFYFYGRALRVLEPGPYFRPWGLMQIKKAPAELDQFQAPGEPEEIFHGDSKLPLPAGKVRPIRITTREPTATEKGHLDVQMTAEWTFYVQFQILDFFMFMSRVGSFENAKKLIRDTGEAVLNEFASKRTLNGMIKDLPKINRKLDDRIRALVNSWGMQVFEAKAFTPDVSHSLATAMRNLPIARLEAEQAETRGKGERRRLEEVGEGTAAAEKAMLLARAAGREALLAAEAKGLAAKKKALEVDGEDILAADVATEMAKGATWGVVGGSDGARDMMGAVLAGREALAKAGSKAA